MFAYTINGKAFFERELEPVPAGHTVSGPVVEVLVGDDTFDAAKIKIAGCVGSGQNEAGIEDVERLVFHCAHVEIVDSNNVK